MLLKADNIWNKLPPIPPPPVGAPEMAVLAFWLRCRRLADLVSSDADADEEEEEKAGRPAAGVLGVETGALDERDDEEEAGEGDSG